MSYLLVFQIPRELGFGRRSLCLAFIKFMGKLADRIFFGVQGPRGLGLGCRSWCLALYRFMGKLADRISFLFRAHGGWVWGAVLCVWPL